MRRTLADTGCQSLGDTLPHVDSNATWTFLVTETKQLSSNLTSVLFVTNMLTIFKPMTDSLEMVTGVWYQQLAPYPVEFGKS